jgi:phospholipase C
MKYEKHENRLTGNIVVQMKNPGPERLTVRIADVSYKTKPHIKMLDPGASASLVLQLHSSHGWYDLTVKPDGSNTEVRMAGRVETGRPSMSDPLMGGII